MMVAEMREAADWSGQEKRSTLMSDFPSGTVTFLFTDVEGSTRRWEDDSPAMLAAIERHFVLLDEAIQANNGVRFKTIGDAIQAAFPTALDALQAAVSAQRALVAEAWGAIGPLRVRMALHTGAATPRDGDYLAPSLNRLSRLLAAGHGGQILLTEAARNLVRDQRPGDLQLRDLGEHHLRDLREAEHVFQVAGAGLPDDFPLLRSLTRETHNLPAQLTTFVGRDQEVRVVKERLQDSRVRLLTLTGPGGTGKTRLSLQVASDLIDVYADGVWFVPLSSITEARLVAGAIAGSLGLRETPGDDVKETLKHYLHAKQSLLILDNFEHVVDAAPLVTELLASCPALQILVTSRAPLRVTGEHELSVLPLGLPSHQPGASMETLLASEAVQLFVDRARSVRPDFALDAQNAATVAAICQRLDGLPLAIELAAARIRLLSPEAILARLDSRLTLLTGGDRDRPERQQTLRAAIAWSHDMLNAEEQALFRRLTVFSGGWTLEAAEAIANGAEPAVSALDCLAALNDNSLITVSDGEPTLRYAMLQTIQEFGAEQLVQRGEADAIGDAHARFFVALASEAEPYLTSPEAIPWLDRLDADYDNFRAALAWLGSRGDSVHAVRLAAALWRFWWLRGHISDGRAALEAALSAGERAVDSRERATALAGAGVLAETQGDYERAEALHRLALSISRNLNDGTGIARSLENLGVLAFDRGEYEAAASLLEESLALAREANDQGQVATALNDLGRVAYERGDLHGADTFYQESLSLRRRIASSLDVARSLNNLGFVAFSQEEHARARGLFEESLELYERGGDRWGAAGPLYGLAVSFRRDGDLFRSTALLERSLALFRETGDARNASVTLLNLGDAAREADDREGAIAYFRESLAGFQAVDDRPGLVAGLSGIAGALARGGDPQRAVTLLAAASHLNVELERSERAANPGPFDADVAMVRDALSREAFDAAWAAGRALSLDEAIALATEEATAR